MSRLIKLTINIEVWSELNDKLLRQIVQCPEYNNIIIEGYRVVNNVIMYMLER